MNQKILVPLVLHSLYVFGAPFTPSYGDGITGQKQISFCGYKSKHKSDLSAFSVLPNGKQDHRNLTYAISNYGKRLPRSTVNSVLAKAFELWSDITDLTFTKREAGSVDIDIRFVVGPHGDDDPFEKDGVVLAHAHLHFIHFNDEENWSTDVHEGIVNLYSVAAHEIGHSLGLGHSDIQGSMMYPNYNDNNVALILHGDDIRGIQSLYGIKIGKVEEPVTEVQIPDGFNRNECTPNWEGRFLEVNCKKSSVDFSFDGSSLGDLYPDNSSPDGSFFDGFPGYPFGIPSFGDPSFGIPSFGNPSFGPPPFDGIPYDSSSSQIPNGYFSNDCTSNWNGVSLNVNCQKSSVGSSSQIPAAYTRNGCTPNWNGLFLRVNCEQSFVGSWF